MSKHAEATNSIVGLIIILSVLAAAGVWIVGKTQAVLFPKEQTEMVAKQQSEATAAQAQEATREAARTAAASRAATEVAWKAAVEREAIDSAYALMEAQSGSDSQLIAAARARFDAAQIAAHGPNWRRNRCIEDAKMAMREWGVEDRSAGC